MITNPQQEIFLVLITLKKNFKKHLKSLKITFNNRLLQAYQFLETLQTLYRVLSHLKLSLELKINLRLENCLITKRFILNQFLETKPQIKRTSYMAMLRLIQSNQFFQICKIQTSFLINPKLVCLIHLKL